MRHNQLIPMMEEIQIEVPRQRKKNYHGYREVLKTYFRDKESSIRRDYREDANSAAVEGVPTSGLHS